MEDETMTVIISGSGLGLDEVTRVARGGERIALAEKARLHMARARAVVEEVLARGDEVYGLTTGVGTLKRVRIAERDEPWFNRRLLDNHHVGLGPTAPPDVVRAAMLRMAAGFAGGHSGVRPQLDDRLVDLLNGNAQPSIRLYGSLGQSDLSANADLAATLIDGLDPAPGEALAVLNNNAFATGWAALAMADALSLLDASEAVGALALEGFAANLTVLHPAVAAARPYPGLAAALERLRALLDGSYLWDTSRARNLQDPLTFRNLAQQQGAARDALNHTLAQLSVELNAAQNNPLVLIGDGRLISAAQYEARPWRQRSTMPASRSLHCLRVLPSARSSCSTRPGQVCRPVWWPKPGPPKAGWRTSPSPLRRSPPRLACWRSRCRSSS
jgi:histidine ammonia-lyase